MSEKQTMVGSIDKQVLDFTSGADRDLDLELVEVDCIGTAAHVKTLCNLPSRYSIITGKQKDKVINELAELIRLARRGRLRIRQDDQDVHLMIERLLTKRLGEIGRKIHTGRSRNDQSAVDTRLFAKRELPLIMQNTCKMASALLKHASVNYHLPMMGRTHSQPAMPSSVGLWASAHAESLLDDLKTLESAMEITDKCPLGSAAGYGAPLPLDRKYTARLLGFKGTYANVLYAGNSRGKYELLVLSALAQLMLTFSRFAEDVIFFSMPEFGYFRLPEGWCTGSSIMPQKRNPDVMELIRARATVMHSYVLTVAGITTGLQSGYSRDLQETKGPFINGIKMAAGCAGILAVMVKEMKPDSKRLKESFRPEVFATDRALELVAKGVSFRDAYKQVRENINEIGNTDPVAALKKRHETGWSGSIDIADIRKEVAKLRTLAKRKEKKFDTVVYELFGINYPDGFE